MNTARSSDSSKPLVDRSVRAFVASVASIDEPVPAGGSVAALTGAASAALLALVCGVLHRRDAGVADLLARGQELQEQLVLLVDEDAEAFRAFLHSKSTEALDRTSQTPLDIAAACLEVVALSREVETVTRGSMVSDVRTARRLASAALASALDIAEQDVLLHADPAAQARLRQEISRLAARTLEQDHHQQAGQ
jgi:formiminotetrahydrofolate cyclodeaminase